MNVAECGMDGRYGWGGSPGKVRYRSPFGANDNHVDSTKQSYSVMCKDGLDIILGLFGAISS